MNVQSFSVSSPEEIGVLLANARREGYNPTLSIVFSTIEADLDLLCKTFKKSGVDLIGCTSAGEIVDDRVIENGIVGLLFDIDPATYRIVTANTSGSSAYSACFSVGLEARNTFENPAILLLSGGIQVDAEQLVFGVKDGVGREIPFFGGLAGDNLQLEKTISFTHEFISENGIVCLVLDSDRIEIQGMATSGWEAIGAENLVTKADGNVLYTINNEPALDVFLRHFGFFDNTRHKGEPVTTLSAQYPLQLVREGGVRVLRSPLFSDNEKRALVLAGGVRTGERFRFSIAPGFEVAEQTVQEFAEFKQQIPSAEAVVLFSCKGRHAALGPVIEEEIEGLFNHWKAPMIGFFTYGEIGNTRSGVCEFHNETCSLVLLREKK